MYVLVYCWGCLICTRSYRCMFCILLGWFSLRGDIYICIFCILFECLIGTRLYTCMFCILLGGGGGCLIGTR